MKPDKKFYGIAIVCLTVIALAGCGDARLKKKLEDAARDQRYDAQSAAYEKATEEWQDEHTRTMRALDRYDAILQLQERQAIRADTMLKRFDAILDAQEARLAIGGWTIIPTREIPTAEKPENVK